MKLKKTEKGQQAKHEVLSKQGRNSKRKGGQYERNIAKKFQDKYKVELKRTPQSGGFAKKSEKADDYRGDITIVDTKQMLLLHIECKAHKTLAMPKWLKQAENDCPVGRTPVVIHHEHGTSNDYITLSYLKFMGMIKKSQDTISVEKPKKEEWLPIPDFDGYFLSNCGRVKSLLSHNGKGKSGNPTILKPGIDSQGYCVVVLRKDNKSYTKRVHKLVAKVFLGVSDEVLINHIDGDKTHNWTTNIEDSSYSNNLQHAYDTGLRPKGEDLKISKLSDIQVAEIRRDLGYNSETPEILADKYGVSVTTINRISSGTYRNPLNLFFVFKNQQKWSLPKWIKQAESDCPEGRVPIVIFHEHNTSNDYVTLSLEDFLNLVPKDKVVGRRSFKK